MKHKDILSYMPRRSPSVPWETDSEGRVTVHMENRGALKKLTQLLLGRPRVSHIQLDEIGSFIWLRIEGEKTVEELGAELEERFGTDARPVYGRLVEYLRILERCGLTCRNHPNSLEKRKKGW